MRLRSIINAALAALLTVSLSSCVHQWPEAAEADFVLHLTFPGEMPQGPVHDIGTRASQNQEDYDVRYIVEAYERLNDGSYAENSAYARFEFSKDDINNLDNTLKIRMMEGEYRFRVWADYIDATTKEPKFYNADNFRYIKLFGRDERIPHEGNNDFRDAFTGHVDAEIIRYGGTHAPSSAAVEMYRPMSKIVFITNDLDDWLTKVVVNQMEMLSQSGQSNVQIDPSSINLNDYDVKIHYPQYMPNAFNLATDRTAWSDVNISFNSKMIKMSDTEAALGFDYVFANEVDPKVVMAVSLHSKDGTQLARSIDVTVPLERGKVTTVIGSFLLEESDGGVSINPDFDGEFNIVL
jgi:hypothetical protein